MFVIWGIPYGIIGGYDLLQGQGYLPSGSPLISQIVPNWLPQIWFIVGVIAIIYVTFEGAYRITQKRQNREEIIQYFAELMRGAEGLGIIKADHQRPELDTVCKEAVEWTMQAIAKISAMVGAVAEKQIRVKLELSLQGEIKDMDFYAPFTHNNTSDKLSIIRKRYYAVYYWIRDFIESAPLNSDK